MRIKKQRDAKLKEIEVLVRYAQENGELRQLLSIIQAVDTRIRCRDEYKERIVNAADVFYIESVDKKTFVYLKQEVLRADGRLYQLKEELSACGFVQISKSCLININVLESVRTLLNSRMEATLSNGERLFVTRKYLADIRQALQEDR